MPEAGANVVHAAHGSREIGLYPERFKAYEQKHRADDRNIQRKVRKYLPFALRVNAPAV